MNKRYLFILTTLGFVFLLLIPIPNSNAVTNWDELAYDDNQAPEAYLVPAANDSVAVRFSPPADMFRLTGMNIRSDTNNLSKICVWVLDNNLQLIMNPKYPSVTPGVPPYTVNFGDAGPIFTPANKSDFYIVVQWITNDTPNLGVGVDNTTIYGRSYTNQSGSWQAYSTGNIMIHALIADIDGPTFDHIPLTVAFIGKDLSVSVDVSDEFGVQSVSLAYRTLGTNESFKGISFTRESGDNMQGIWFGRIPGEHINASGIEYYIWATDIGFNIRSHGNATVPFEVQAVQLFEMPLIGSIIIIVSICAVGVVIYLKLPEYKGEDTK